MSDKRYSGSRHSERDDYMYERRAKKKAMRDEHKDRWRYSPANTYLNEESDDDETDDWERYRTS